ncbi:abortive infection family protein [Coleofasciculus sp. E1-EBD-02]|uniref:abortive infection family protein n=1 Tax=Coleofasciculus sp. E1-EBD-02 TaxID=3068481 RepID=UPI0033008E39
MHKLTRLRELVEKYRRWHSLAQFVNRIELVYASDLDSAISNAHSLIETILKTILFERVEEYENEKKLKSIKINKLASETLKNINLVRCRENSNFISGMITSIQNLGEIRNGLSHGKNLHSLEDEKTEELTAFFLMNSVETIACFLIEFYEVEYPLKSKGKEIKYEDEDYRDFNDWLDDEHGTVMVAGIPIMTSIALFGDLIAYQDKYQEYLLAKDNEEVD